MNGPSVERPKNGQVDQRLRRRPRPADAYPRPTPGLSHSHSLGLTGAKIAPKGRGSPSEATPNGDHDNSTSNSIWNGSTNGSTATRTVNGNNSSHRTAWELSALIRPLPVRHRSVARRPRILAHYPAMVRYVYDSRFVTASQVQRRFATALPSLRTAQYELANLLRLGFLQIAPVRSTSPNFPYVYFTTRLGFRRFVKPEAGDDALPDSTENVKKDGIALHSLLHELLISELLLAVERTVAQRHDLTLHNTERRYFRRDKRLRFERLGAFQSVVPDAGFLVAARQANGKRTGLLHAVELDNGTMARRRMLDKYRAYAAWFTSPEAAEYLQQMSAEYDDVVGSSWRLLIVAHDKDEGADLNRLRQLFTWALEPEVWPALRDRAWFTTVEQLRQFQGAFQPLSAPIWIRARDAKPWIREFRAALATEGNTGRARQRAMTAARLTDLPRHPLFSATG